MTTAPFTAQRCKHWPLHRRLILLGTLAALFYFGGDILTPLLEEGTQILLEALEMFVEEFYEHVLHLSRRVAEIFTVWSGAIIALALLYVIVRSIVRRIVRAYAVSRDWCRKPIVALIAWRHTWSEADIAILGVIGSVVIFMLLSLFL